MNYVRESISKASFGLLMALVFSGCATEERLDVSCNEYFSNMASSDFTDLGNGLVRDSETQLYWYKCPLGQTFVSGKCTGKVLDADFETAQGTVKNFRLPAVSSPNAPGYWRLPTESEYEKLTSVPCHSPSIDVTAFPNIDIETFYWSSEDSERDSFACGTHIGENRAICKISKKASNPSLIVSEDPGISQPLASNG
jgi:hypothetical protein